MNGMFEGQEPRNFLLEIKEHGALGYYIWEVVQPKSWAHYWIDEAGTDAWDYADPCRAWDLATQVYDHRVNSLLIHRAEMYDAYRNKIQSLYPGQDK